MKLVRYGEKGAEQPGIPGRRKAERGDRSQG